MPVSHSVSEILAYLQFNPSSTRKSMVGSRHKLCFSLHVTQFVMTNQQIQWWFYLLSLQRNACISTSYRSLIKSWVEGHNYRCVMRIYILLVTQYDAANRKHKYKRRLTHISHLGPCPTCPCSYLFLYACIFLSVSPFLYPLICCYVSVYFCPCFCRLPSRYGVSECSLLLIAHCLPALLNFSILSEINYIKGFFVNFAS